jgi:hypothetical protein
MKNGISVICLTLIIAVNTVFFGCDEGITNSEPTNEYGRVGFIHAAASTGEIDFKYLSLDEPVYEYIFQGATYCGQYGYYYFVTGSRSFRVYLTNTNISVASDTIVLAEDEKYTIIANDLEATINPELLAYPDTLALPATGKVFLRFIHVSADAPDLNVHDANDSLLVSILVHYQSSAYLELDAGTHEFDVYFSDSLVPYTTLDPFTLISGNNYTVVLSGSVDGLPGPAFNGELYLETGL